MKKATFLIMKGTIKEPVSVVPVEGYVFSIGLYIFGVKKFDKHWRVFELTTGTCVCVVDKRADAVDVTARYIDAIYKTFSGMKKGDILDRCNDMIRDGYDFMHIKFPYNA